MGKSARLKRERRAAREKAGVRKLYKGEKVGTLDDLTDDIELFLCKMHNKAKHTLRLAVLQNTVSGDKSEKQEMIASGVSCDKCSTKTKGCCNLAVGTLLFEGLPVLRKLRKEGKDTPELRERLRTVGDTMEDMTQEEWFETRTPCVFLTDEQRCSIYNVRPSACSASPTRSWYPHFSGTMP